MSFVRSMRKIPARLWPGPGRVMGAYIPDKKRGPQRRLEEVLFPKRAAAPIGAEEELGGSYRTALKVYAQRLVKAGGPPSALCRRPGNGPRSSAGRSLHATWDRARACSAIPADSRRTTPPSEPAKPPQSGPAKLWTEPFSSTFSSPHHPSRSVATCFKRSFEIQTLVCGRRMTVSRRG